MLRIRFLCHALLVAGLVALPGVALADLTNTGEDVAVVFTGHQLTVTAGPAERVLYAPSNPNDPVFRANVAAELGGAIVDYFDARFDTPDPALLSTYDAVYTWANSAYDDSVLFGDRLATFVDDGGVVVLGAWCVPSAIYWLEGQIMTPDYCPVAGDEDHRQTATWDGTGDTCIYDGVTAFDTYYHDVLTLQGAGIADGYYDDGHIAHAYRPDFRVVYSNGLGVAGLMGTGDWPRLIANATYCGLGEQVLIWNESSHHETMITAADNLGLGATVVYNETDFVAQLTTGDWNLIVIENPANTITEPTAAAIETHVLDGGRAFLQYWDLDGNSLYPVASGVLRDTFGVAATTEFTVPQDVYAWEEDHPIWTTPNTLTMLPWVSDDWLDNGDELTPALGALPVGGFTMTPQPGQAGIIVNHGCRTIVNGFMFDDMDLGLAVQSAENQLTFLLERSVLMYNEWTPSYARNALENLGLCFTERNSEIDFLADLADGGWDLVLVDRPNTSASPAFEVGLTDYIVSGGKLHLSYWLLQDTPALYGALGVATPTPFFDPQQVWPWLPTHPTYTTPHSVGVLDLSFLVAWGINGQELLPQPGAVVPGGFTSGSMMGQGATVIANGDRTIVNGFLYTDFVEPQVTDLLENQIVFLTGGVPVVEFKRGDCNVDNSFNIADAVATLSILFVPGTAPASCVDACDSNDDGSMNIADAVFSLSSLFVPFSPQPSAPFPGCGADPTADMLGCVSYTYCP